MGVAEVSVSDTIGKASPEEVARLLDGLLPKVNPTRIAVHFHDTYGRGVANVLTSWSYGIRIFDASVGGLGGCPFVPGATGNVATESVVAALERQGAPVGVDLEKLEYARGLLNPYLVEEYRAAPKGYSQACAVCEYAEGEACCSRKEEKTLP